MSFETSFNWAEQSILCFGEKPGRWRAVEEDLQMLKDAGVKSILSLVEEEPKLDAYRRGGFEILHVPIDDCDAPSPGQFDQCIEFISANAPVYVHCYAGYGRAGTISAAWLIHNGMKALEAIKIIRQIRPGAIEVDIQFDSLLQYEARSSPPLR